MQDLLGINNGKIPAFAKNFLSESDSIQKTIQTYIDEVKTGVYSSKKYSF